MTTTEYLKSKEPNWIVVPEDFLQEYTKIKCQELLEIVAEKAIIKQENEYAGLKGYALVTTVDKDSILNAVDLETFII